MQMVRALAIREAFVASATKGLANLFDGLLTLVEQSLALGSQFLDESRDLGEPFQLVTVLMSSRDRGTQTTQVFPCVCLVLLAEPPTSLSEFAESFHVNVHNHSS